ncbi:hypothetical protein PG991_011722 [Apiospora marii]|uniref:Fungal-type protein kinase domain-containing protein n=1 Tax=Apiospora marii TaxID=335849 RepID=A0ABR1RF41_9PEZI
MYMMPRSSRRPMWPSRSTSPRYYSSHGAAIKPAHAEMLIAGGWRTTLGALLLPYENALLKFRQNAVGGTEVYGHQIGPIYRNHHEYQSVWVQVEGGILVSDIKDGLKTRDEKGDRSKLHLFALVRRLFELAGGREDPWQYHTCLQRDYAPDRSLVRLGSIVGASGSPNLQDLRITQTLQFLSGCKAFENERLTKEALKQRTHLIIGLLVNPSPVDLPAAFLVDLSRIKCAEFRVYKMETKLKIPMLEDHITSAGFFLCWRSCFDPSVEIIGYVRSPEGRKLLQPHFDTHYEKSDVGRLAISLLVMHWFFYLRGTDNNGGEIQSGVDCLNSFCSLLHGQELPNAQWVVAKHLRALKQVFHSLVPELSTFLQGCGTWTKMIGDDVEPVLADFWQSRVQGVPFKVAFDKATAPCHGISHVM